MVGITIAQPVLVHALDIFAEEAPLPTERAARALNILLAGVDTSPWQEVAWVFSRLTGDGFPVEFSFVSNEASLRYTVEIAGPEQDTAGRLDLAEQLLASLCAPSLSAEMGKMLHGVQKGQELDFGVWVGGRHSADEDRYKLYVETPRAGTAITEQIVQRFLGEKSLLPKRAPQLVMLGHEPGSARIELYFRIGRLEEWELALLLQRAQLATRQEELLNLVERAHGHSVRQVLPGNNLGCSFSISLEGGPLLFSLFAYARSIFGGDKWTRQWLIEQEDVGRWNQRSYARLSASLAQRNNWRTLHGIVSFVVPPQGPLLWHIGLCPPGPER
jgi:hypothetical protein